MAIEYKEHPDLKLVEIIVDGKVTKQVFDDIVPKMEKFIEEHGKVKIIEIIKDFAGFEFAAIGEGVRFDMKHLKDFSHCAVVCEDGWIGPMTRMIAPFFTVDIRTFSMDQEDEARDWLASAA